MCLGDVDASDGSRDVTTHAYGVGVRESDIRPGVVERAVRRLGTEFHTKDVSEDAEVLDAHRPFAGDGNYHPTFGKALSGMRGRLRITEVSKGQGRGSLWRKVEVAETQGSAPRVATSTDPRPIRDGHWRSVHAMKAGNFREIVRLFDARPEIGGTYFRVVEKGFQPVDLDAGSPKPLIGVGPAFASTATAGQLERELEGRTAELLRKRATVAPSPEKQIEARFVRAALRNGLRLDPLPSSLRLVASQWRIDLGGTGRPLDLVAVDVTTRSLVVVELKAVADPAAVIQANEYAAAMRAWAPEVFDFFAALGRAMATVYGGADMPEVLEPGAVRAVAAWPAGNGAFEVVPCP